MTVSIRFLGTAAFNIITDEGKRILIDPYLDENPVSPIKVDDLDHLDLLLVTHELTITWATQSQSCAGFRTCR